MAVVERDLRSLKTIDLELRPVHHWTEDRVRAHVLICLLAGYLTWHLRQALAPLTFTDTEPTPGETPVAPARRSAVAARKASTRTTAEGTPTYSYPALLDHLATLTRDQMRAGEVSFELLADPTEVQARAFTLLGAPVPLRLS